MDYDDSDGLAYLQSEVQQLREQLDRWKLYSLGMPALPGYKWEINERGIYEVIDITQLSKEHSAFVAYKEQMEHCESWNDDEGYNLWEEQILNPSLNGMFQLVYKFRVSNLIPDNVKLFELIKEKK